MIKIQDVEMKQISSAAAAALASAGTSIPQLRAALNGRLITPEDGEYDQARTPFYGGFDRRPALIIRSADWGDVSRVVSLARDAGLELAVRSGGHSVAGHSVSHGGIVLDLADMKALQNMDGVLGIRSEGSRVEILINRREDSLDRIVKLFHEASILDIEIKEVDLEDVFIELAR